MTSIKTKVILVGHDESRGILHEITKGFREHGDIAAAYFDETIPFAYNNFDSSNVFVLGLSRAGRQSEGVSEAYDREDALLRKLSKQAPQLSVRAVVADIDGYISAHHLTTTHASLFNLVASNDPKVNSMGIFAGHRNVARDAPQIVNAIKEMIAAPVRV